jgi:hypothetical protein
MDVLNLYVVTFNCARELINPKPSLPTFRCSTFYKELFPPPDIIILALQELAPVLIRFSEGVPDPIFQPVSTCGRARGFRSGKWKLEVQEHCHPQLGMTAIMIFVRQDHVGAVKRIETAGVGVGLLEMGNKGAVGVRLGYSTGASDNEIMKLTFVAAPAPMEHALARRNEDWINIVSRLVFAPLDQVASHKRARSPSGDSEEAPSPWCPKRSRYACARPVQCHFPPVLGR